jgi:hypothetical protein
VVSGRASAYSDRVADYLQTAKPVRRRGYAMAVTLAGALLVFCAILPWAGVEARSDLLGGAVSNDLRGIDDRFGVYTLIAGVAALAFGVTGLLTRPKVAALGVIPGALAALVLVMFVSDSSGMGDRVSVELGNLLSIEPVLRFGWYAALGSAIAVILASVLTLLRRA